MSEPVVSLVVAAARNGVIGRDGDMPWRLRADLARFKRLTLGRPLVMGRRTFASIGRPLPGRHTIVVTRDRDWHARGTEVANDPQAGLERALRWAREHGEPEACIVGGGEIYDALRERATLMRLTLVDAEPDGDTRFALPDDGWERLSDVHVPAGPRDSHATRYGLLRRRRAFD